MMLAITASGLWHAQHQTIIWTNDGYRKVSNISRTKSQDLNASRLIL